MTPELRRLHAQIAPNTKWSRPIARADQGGAARAASFARLEWQVSVNQALQPEHRAILVATATRCLSAQLNTIYVPEPVLLLVIANATLTMGVPVPDDPVIGLRYPASSIGASVATVSQRTLMYISRSDRSRPLTPSRFSGGFDEYEQRLPHASWNCPVPGRPDGVTDRPASAPAAPDLGRAGEQP